MGLAEVYCHKVCIVAVGEMCVPCMGHAAHTCCKLFEKVKYTNFLFDGEALVCVFPEGVSPLGRESCPQPLASRKACPDFCREWFVVRHALKEERLQNPVLTNRNGI